MCHMARGTCYIDMPQSKASDTSSVRLHHMFPLARTNQLYKRVLRLTFRHLETTPGEEKQGASCRQLVV